MLQVHQRMRKEFDLTFLGFLRTPEQDALYLFVHGATGQIIPCLIPGSLDMSEDEAGPLKSQSFQLGWDDEEEDYDFEYDDDDDDDDDLFDDSDDMDDDFDDDYDDLDDEIDDFDDDDEEDEEEDEEYSEEDEY